MIPVAVIETVVTSHSCSSSRVVASERPFPYKNYSFPLFLSIDGNQAAAAAAGRTSARFYLFELLPSLHQTRRETFFGGTGHKDRKIQNSQKFMA